MHTRALLKQGEPIEKLALVQAWKEAGSLFDDREKAGLAWAETVTRVAETGVPDDAYEAARNVFDDRELTDLTIAIGLMNRSEEHASELQSLMRISYAVFCLNKKMKTVDTYYHRETT